MYRIEWTEQAYLDLQRLYDFLSPLNLRAAQSILSTLATAPEKLVGNPRIGERLMEFNPNEIRRLWIDRYELRYEIYNDVIYILRLWHTREDR